MKNGKMAMFLVTVMVVGALVPPTGTANHDLSDDDCSDSGLGDGDCSTTEACSRDAYLYVRAWVSDGETNEIYGGFSCGGESVSCYDDNDPAGCAGGPSNLTGSSGSGSCNGWTEEDGGDYQTFYLACEDHDSSTVQTSKIGNSPRDGLYLTVEDGIPQGEACEDGVCHAAPADCSIIGEKRHCSVTGGHLPTDLRLDPTPSVT